MEPTITVRSQRNVPRADEGEFQNLLRRYEVRERVEGRVRTLGGLYLAISALGILSACIAFTAIAPWGLLSGDPTATALLAGLGGTVAAVLLVLSAPGLIGGLALLTRRPWARLYAMVFSAVILFWFPLGTILGTYSLYVLLQPDTRFYFESHAPSRP
jgi:hypothetical protein